MTHHYTVEIISKKVFFKVTYRDKKFKKIERLRGQFDQDLMNYVGKTIPIHEDDIPNFSKKWFQRVNYKIEAKNDRGKTLYTQFLEQWNTFYLERTDLKYKFTGADGNALKQVIKHFKSISRSDEGSLEMWQVLLSQWDNLSDFHKKQTDLKYINSKLNVIITEIKTNITGTGTANSKFEFS